MRLDSSLAPREKIHGRVRLPSVFVVSRQLLQQGDLRGKLFHPVQRERERGYACVCAERGNAETDTFSITRLIPFSLTLVCN